MPKNPGQKSRDGAIARNVRLLRRAREWSQEELADRAGCTRQTVSNIERLRNAPDLETLQPIASALGVEIGTLLDSESTTYAVDVVRLRDQVEMMNASERERFFRATEEVREQYLRDRGKK
ncbi:MAG TPA: helix-turn-helix transcriptional regulator [Thermoanaerobaculia bacterium]|nr:helix-turn-helix transcriptional regulator [Thermoanaerobaculia bacterium]